MITYNKGIINILRNKIAVQKNETLGLIFLHYLQAL